MLLLANNITHTPTSLVPKNGSTTQIAGPGRGRGRGTTNPLRNDITER